MTKVLDLDAKVLALHERTRNVHGWLTPAEGNLLYSMARTAATGDGAVIVEIGSWKGKSTIYLASGSLAGPRLPVYAIDPHTGSTVHREKFGEVATFAEFQNNIRSAGVDSMVVALVSTSREAAASFKEPISLLFIDGEHAYDSVREDFELWSPKVVTGGYIAFHDSCKPGPRRLIREAVCGSTAYTHHICADSITVVRKVATNTAFDRWRDRFVFQKYLMTKVTR